jgi:DNA-binding helix-hairpin-helix protein with protein kinase domain
MSHRWILPIGTELSFEGLSWPIKILRGLGAGTQGQVFAVDFAGEELALKWYLPACIASDPHLKHRLNDSISRSAPNSNFLWPIALVMPTPATAELIPLAEPGFGYLMRLRPSGFLGAFEHAGGDLEISLQNVVKAGFYLADAFHELHLKGLCYKDISLGNLFLEPSTGKILICDNDNVDINGRELGNVLGTPGFMAPEILLRQAKPGAESDLFSLAVLLFRLLTRHDPLKGQLELAIRCLDEPARRRLYGEDPVFIFDPNDIRNRPDPEEHAAALVTWPIYPRRIQALFEQAFCAGIKQPSQRPFTGQWKSAMARCLDQRVICPHCNQEAFPEHGSKTSCWNCGEDLGPATSMELAAGQVATSAGNELHAYHFDKLSSESLSEPVAKVVAHPSDPAILGLQNLTSKPWRGERLDGHALEVEPGKSCNLAPLRVVHTPQGTITILR